MGDHGQLYVQPDVIPVYKDMMKFAKAITPNQFEAEILADTKITDVRSCLETIDILHKTGVEHVIITSVSLLPGDVKTNLIGSSYQQQANGKDHTNGIHTKGNTNGNTNGHHHENGNHHASDAPEEAMYCVCSSKTSDKSASRVYAIEFPTYDGYFTGTGDLFSAVLVARLYESLSEKEVTDKQLPPLARACLKVVATMRAVVLRTFQAQAGTKGRSLDRKQASAAAVIKQCELQLIQSKRDIEDPRMEDVEAVELQRTAAK